jgi:hypothetical protein
MEDELASTWKCGHWHVFEDLQGAAKTFNLFHFREAQAQAYRNLYPKRRTQIRPNLDSMGNNDIKRAHYGKLSILLRSLIVIKPVEYKSRE